MTRSRRAPAAASPAPGAGPGDPSPGTPLARMLERGSDPRATPLALFDLARQRWHASGRIDIGALAAELGIGRATAFRWVGSRDRLMGELLWADCDLRMRAAAQAQRGRGRGPRRIGAVCAHAVQALAVAEPLRRFLREEPEQALRLLTSKRGPVQGRAIARVREMLEHELRIGALEPPLPLDTLAFLVVRLCESFLYAETISDQNVDPSQVALAIELLLSGRVQAEDEAARGSGHAAQSAADGRIRRGRATTPRAG